VQQSPGLTNGSVNPGFHTNGTRTLKGVLQNVNAAGAIIEVLHKPFRVDLFHGMPTQGCRQRVGNPYCSSQVVQVPASSGCWACALPRAVEACGREPAPRDFRFAGLPSPVEALRKRLVGRRFPKEDILQDTHHPVTNVQPNRFDDLPRVSDGMMRFDRERITQMQLLDGSAIRFSPGQSLRVSL
jgi:hypothetical protein